jgi:hypothetical protein
MCGSNGSHRQKFGGISMGGKGSKGLDKEAIKLHKGVGRFEKKLNDFRRKERGF